MGPVITESGPWVRPIERPGFAVEVFVPVDAEGRLRLATHHARLLTEQLAALLGLELLVSDLPPEALVLSACCGRMRKVAELRHGQFPGGGRPGVPAPDLRWVCAGPCPSSADRAAGDA